jgi:hypothetical protein
VEQRTAAKKEATVIRWRLVDLGRSLRTIGDQLASESFETAGVNVGLLREDIVDVSGIRELIQRLEELRVRTAQLAGYLAEFGVE